MNTDEISEILDSLIGKNIRGNVATDAAFIYQANGLIQLAVDFSSDPEVISNRDACLSVIFGSLDCLRESLKTGVIEWWFEDELTEDGYPIWGLQELEDE